MERLVPLRLIVSVEEGLGKDVVSRLGFFKNRVSVRAHGGRLEFEFYVDLDTVAGFSVFQVIYVAVPDPPKVREDEEWFAAPSNLFDEAIAEDDLTFGLLLAPFAIDANALVCFQSVVVDVSELFKALATEGN